MLFIHQNGRKDYNTIPFESLDLESLFLVSQYILSKPIGQVPISTNPQENKKSFISYALLHYQQA